MGESGGPRVTRAEWEQAARGEVALTEDARARYWAAYDDPTAEVHLWDVERYGETGRARMAATEQLAAVRLARVVAFVRLRREEGALAAAEASEILSAGGRVGGLATADPRWPTRLPRLRTSAVEAMGAVVAIAAAVDRLRPDWHADLVAAARGSGAARSR